MTFLLSLQHPFFPCLIQMYESPRGEVLLLTISFFRIMAGSPSCVLERVIYTVNGDKPGPTVFWAVGAP